jgi:D-alanyl-D-alanine carboxypeptidase
MNKKAIELELTKTRYVNPSGVDPDGDNELGNESSAHDVFMLMRFLFENKLDLVATASLKELKIKTESGRDVALVNTDELLGSSIGRITVQAGKTGETPRAKQNLVVIASAPCEGVLYAVVLGSQNRSADMRALLTYADTAYRWDCE